jgi:hypothetical protein
MTQHRATLLVQWEREPAGTFHASYDVPPRLLASPRHEAARQAAWFRVLERLPFLGIWDDTIVTATIVEPYSWTETDCDGAGVTA